MQIYRLKQKCEYIDEHEKKKKKKKKRKKNAASAFVAEIIAQNTKETKCTELSCIAAR